MLRKRGAASKDAGSSIRDLLNLVYFWLQFKPKAPKRHRGKLVSCRSQEGRDDTPWMMGTM